MEHQLSVRGLRTVFRTREGMLEAVAGVDLHIPRGTTYGVVGESGCGKSVASLSILRLLPKNGSITGGEILFDRRGTVVDLAALDPAGPEIREIRGAHISMVFQEPMTSFSPVLTIGRQVSEVLVLHHGCGRAEARERTLEMFWRVGLARPSQTFDAYPFNLSGGMRQRAMISMALACNPQLIIADEPTSALDVTIQEQILRLFADLQREFGMAIMLITHDLGVVAEAAERMTVMYLGTDVETGPVPAVFARPLHPYTRGLLASVPRLGRRSGGVLVPIPGTVPSLADRPAGCPFVTRCAERIDGLCDHARPPSIDLGEGRFVRCYLHGGRP